MHKRSRSRSLPGTLAEQTTPMQLQCAAVAERTCSAFTWSAGKDSRMSGVFGMSASAMRTLKRRQSRCGCSGGLTPSCTTTGMQPWASASSARGDQPSPAEQAWSWVSSTWRPAQSSSAHHQSVQHALATHLRVNLVSALTWCGVCAFLAATVVQHELATSDSSAHLGPQDRTLSAAAARCTLL